MVKTLGFFVRFWDDVLVGNGILVWVWFTFDLGFGIWFGNDLDLTFDLGWFDFGVCLI